MISELPALPALKTLGDLAKAKPTIVIDTREQTPLTFIRLQSVSGTLQSGDYSFLGGEVRYNLPVVWSDSPSNAALLVESWAWWVSREIVQGANELLRGSQMAEETAP